MKKTVKYSGIALSILTCGSLLLNDYAQVSANQITNSSSISNDEQSTKVENENSQITDHISETESNTNSVSNNNSSDSSVSLSESNTISTPIENTQVTKESIAASEESGNVENFTAVGKINYVPNYGIMIWDNFNNTKKPLNRYLKHGTSWKIFKKATINNAIWYNLGGNQWVEGKYVIVQDNKPSTPSEKPTPYKSVVKIDYKTSILVWNNFDNTRKGINKYLKPGTSWKTSSKVHYNGELWYNLGGNQWIPAMYTNQKSDVIGKIENINKVGYINYQRNRSVAIWNDFSDSRHNTGKYLKHWTSWKLKRQVNYKGTIWYDLGNNQWVPSTYITVGSHPILNREKIAQRATYLANLHIPYVWDATSIYGCDCSGLVWMAINDTTGLKLPADSWLQGSVVDLKPYEKLQRGDLVYWQYGGQIHHTGVYLGNGKVAENLSGYSKVVPMYRNQGRLKFVGGGQINQVKLANYTGPWHHTASLPISVTKAEKQIHGIK